MNNWYKKYFIPQKMMRSVLLVALPLLFFGTYLFGLRVLAMFAIVTLVGTLTEFLFQRHYGKKVSEAVFVSSLLFVLTLPAGLPIWMAVVGIIFGIFFGKLVFGGFGTNPFNPALVARAFIYINFPNQITIEWSKVAQGFPGGFGQWLTAPIDTVTEATPMILFKNTQATLPFTDIALGFIPGSIGETATILIILAAIYLIWKKIASWEVMAGGMIGFLILQSVFHYLTNVSAVDPITGIVSGGILFALVFMATDPISCCKTKEGKFIFGILVGTITVLIRTLALFNGGAMFAILMANTFAPIIDIGVREFKKKSKVKGELA